MGNNCLAAKTISVLLILLGFCAENSCLAQARERTNQEILEQNISAELDKFFYFPDVNRSLQFVFYVEPVKKDNLAEKKFTEQIVKKTAERNNIRYSISKDETMASKDSSYYKARIRVNKLRTLYPAFAKDKFLGEKTMRREITSDMNVEIKLSDGTSLVKDDIKTVYKGEIPYDEYEQYENEDYPFTQALPPDVSLMETIFFPALIIVVSAVATILFFSVRSK